MVGQPRTRSANRRCFIVGILVSGLVGYVTVKYFLRFVASRGLDVFAWYRIAAWRSRRGLAADPRRALNAMVQWLRRRFITGFFVVVPVVASVAALVWTFRVIDGFTAPIYARLLGRLGARPGAADDGGRRADRRAWWPPT